MGEVFYKRIFLLFLFVCSAFLIIEIVNYNRNNATVISDGFSVNDVLIESNSDVSVSNNVITGFVVHPIYSGFSAAESGFTFNNNTRLLSVTDTAVYKTGYYSINGSSWISFTLTGAAYGTSSVWLTETTTKTLPNFGFGEHYVIIYSCEYNTTSSSWNCYGNRWQLIVINNTPAVVPPVTLPNCSDGIKNQGETSVDCGGPCKVCSAPALRTFYISPSGSDSASGSVSAPWKTLSHACATAKTLGDLIHVNAGSYTESSQCSLAVGVSIEGEGANSVIHSRIASDFAIILSSGTPGTDGSQHISNLKMDGDSLTGYGAIKVSYRSNVDIYDCTFVHFNYYGVGFYGGGEYKLAPTIWSTGNKFHDNTVDDCSAYVGTRNEGEGKGAITVDGQDGILIYNNILSQTSRPAGKNGYLIKGVDGWNKGIKIYNNVITKATYDGITWYFAIELWHGRGGNEIYGNTITGGGIDISGGGGNIKGDYAYSTWIHDNTIGDNTPSAYEETVGIYLETNQEYVIVERNHIKNVGMGVYFPTYEDWMKNTCALSNINIRYNIIENIGGTNTGNGWGIFIGHSRNDNTVNNFNVYNNVFIGRAGNNADLTGIVIPAIGTESNINIKNNIIQGFGYTPIYAEGGSGISIDYLSIENNIFYSNGYNNVPRFSSITPTHYTYQNNKEGVNPSFVSSSNFHLQSNSPAINNGTNVGLTKDYDNKSIVGLPDIGAFEK